MTRLLALLLILGVVAGDVGCSPAVDFRPRDERYAACGRRGVMEGATVTGTVHLLKDATPLDGPVNLVVIDAAGRPRKLYFGALFTRPAPTQQRQATYRAIAPTQAGDCIQARGTALDDGRLWVEEFVNLDRPLRSR